MPPITMYTTASCPYCHAARALLRKKGAEFREIDVNSAPDLRSEMRQRAGGRNTVPQIWIGATHVGGCEDLYALEHAGRLDLLLAG